MCKTWRYLVSLEALQKYLKYYRVKKSNVMVVFDDTALDLGTVRYRLDGTAGGHNGMR